MRQPVRHVGGGALGTPAVVNLVPRKCICIFNRQNEQNISISIQNVLTAFQAHITNLSVGRIFPEVHRARKLHSYSETDKIHIAH
jgi:hypothetical protein